MHPRKQVGTRHLTVRYLLILALLAGLALTNFLILRAEIQTNRHIAQLVAEGGEQRSLLQESALLSQKYVQKTETNHDVVRVHLLQTIDDLETLHNTLIRRDRVTPMPATARAIYFDEPRYLDRAMKNFIGHVRKLTEVPEEQLSWRNEHMTAIDEAALSGEMLDGLNKIVDAYQKRSEQRTHYIQSFAFWSFIGTFAVLLVSGAFVFRPMVRRVKSEMASLAELNNNLERRVAQRTSEAERRASELLASEVALRDQSRVLSSILENMGDGVIVLDSDGRFQLFNSKARDILSIKPADPLPNDWSNEWLDHFGVSLCQADGSEPFPMDNFPLIRSLRGEDVDRAQICVRRSDESITWLSVTARPLHDGGGRVQGSVAVLRDTTERKRAEDALRKSEALYRSLVDNLPLYVLRKDLDGRFSWVNENFCRLVNQPASAIIGKTDFDFYSSEVAAKNRADDQRVVDHGIVFHDVEVHRTAEGDHIHLEVLKTPVRNGTGTVVETQTILLDVTSRVEAERRLVQSERLAAIGQMVAGVAHESRNALQQIQACCGLLQWKLNGKSDVHELLDDLQKAQDRLRRLFDDLREYAAPLKIDKRICDLRDVVTEAWRLIEPERRNRDASLQIDAESSNTKCLADPLQMEQVFRNLLENSLAACHDPVVIKVTIEEWAAPSEQIHASVFDNGPGLTTEQQSRAFEPFYTTKSKGTGLGMAITKRIVEAHEGQIQIGNAPQGGAIVGITLPRGDI